MPNRPHDLDDDLGQHQGDVAVIRTPVRQYRPTSDGHGSARFVLERETVLRFYRWMPSTAGRSQKPARRRSVKSPTPDDP